ncbi:hypothetical protein LWI29_009958 [Acer saccharum]|uniref:RNase H type-1 domain-containing protein n=1 Tax=Acer saccharum TaxID=4024 RepID=A0AA39RVH9_ACESA|nr:hypothetical protein LWI29_009958 [Acer saccharum]
MKQRSVALGVGCFKLNVDAALNADYGKFGAGLVFRNDHDIIVHVAALQLTGTGSVDVAKARAIFEGFSMAIGKGLLPLVIGSDSLGVVNLCLGKVSSRNDIVNIVKNIQFLLNRYVMYQFLLFLDLVTWWHILLPNMQCVYIILFYEILIFQVG